MKPPNGWNSVAWELAIVVVGVLIALAAQQWADERSVDGEVQATKAALRDELADHYSFAVEFRVVYPCIQAQLDTLRQHVLSGERSISPVPIYEEEGDKYVVRIPSKPYPRDAWDAAISDGLIQRLPPSLRQQLGGHYAQLATVEQMRWANNEAEQELVALGHKLPVDPTARLSLITAIERFGGRLEYLDFINGQVLDYIEQVRMKPPSSEAHSVARRYGTYQFCKTHDLPLRPFEDAMRPIPN